MVLKPEVNQPKNKPDFHVNSIIFGLERNRSKHATKSKTSVEVEVEGRGNNRFDLLFVVVFK